MIKLLSPWNPLFSLCRLEHKKCKIPDKSRDRKKGLSKDNFIFLYLYQYWNRFPPTYSSKVVNLPPQEKTHSSVTLSFPSFHYSTSEVLQVKERDTTQWQTLSGIHKDPPSLDFRLWQAARLDKWKEVEQKGKKALVWVSPAQNPFDMSTADTLALIGVWHGANGHSALQYWGKSESQIPTVDMTASNCWQDTGWGKNNTG